jgi:single-stranded-DNA-specific exonuclease
VEQKWTVPTVDAAQVRAVAEACDLDPLVAHILLARGFTDVETIGRFLARDLPGDWLDPAGLPGLVAVADELEEAMCAGKRIMVYGDFDVDGLSATAP